MQSRKVEENKTKLVDMGLSGSKLQIPVYLGWLLKNAPSVGARNQSYLISMGLQVDALKSQQDYTFDLLVISWNESQISEHSGCYWVSAEWYLGDAYSVETSTNFEKLIYLGLQPALKIQNFSWFLIVEDNLRGSLAPLFLYIF